MSQDDTGPFLYRATAKLMEAFRLGVSILLGLQLISLHSSERSRLLVEKVATLEQLLLINRSRYGRFNATYTAGQIA